MAERFGPYSLIRQIASGGMAEVHLARAPGQDGRGRALALKMVHPQFSEDEEFIDALIEEAKLSVQLDHPAIAAIFDLGKIDDRFYLSMEFVDGRDLFQLLVRTSGKGVYIPLDDAAFVGTEMCRGLHYAHTRNDDSGQPMRIVHRDVSPQNVLVSWRGEVKICDFGIAKAATRASHTRAGVIKGKFSYMSPEQSWGDPLDARSDTFSAGICVWEAICGEMLYSEEEPAALLDRVRKAEIEPPSARRTDVPQELDDIILKALEREPARRWQTAEAFANALEAWQRSFSPSYDPRGLGELLMRSFPEFEPLKESEGGLPAAGDQALAAPPQSAGEQVADTRQMSTMARDDFAPDPEHSMIFNLADIGDSEGLSEDGEGDPAPAPKQSRTPAPTGDSPQERPLIPAPEATTMLKADQVQAALADSRMQPTLPPGAVNVETLEKALRTSGFEDAPVEEGLGGATVMMDARKMSQLMTPPPGAIADDAGDTSSGPAPLMEAPASANPFEQKTAFLSTDDPAIAAVLAQAKQKHDSLLSGDAAPEVDSAPTTRLATEGLMDTSGHTPTPTPTRSPPAATVMAQKAPLEEPLADEASVKVVKATQAQVVSPVSLPETVAATSTPIPEPTSLAQPSEPGLPVEPAPTDPARRPPDDAAVEDAAAVAAAAAAAKAKAAADADTKAEAKAVPAGAPKAKAKAKADDKPAAPASAGDKVAAAKAQMAKKKEAGAKKKEKAKAGPGPSKMGRVAKGTPARAFSPGVILTLAGVLIFGGITLNFILGMFSVANGGARFTSDPTGATITLNGKLLKSKTPFTVKGLAADKSHKLAMKLDGFQRHEEEFDVAPEDVSPVHVILEPDPGSLKISSEPKGAQVYIDGQRRGVTPVKVEGLPRDLELPVTLKKKGYEDLQRIHVWGEQHDDLHFVLEKRRRRRRR